jgi:hypothetical protein
MRRDPAMKHLNLRRRVPGFLADNLCHQISAPPPKAKERQKEGRRSEGDRQAEHDLHEAPEAAAGIAEGEGESGYNVGRAGR